MNLRARNQKAERPFVFVNMAMTADGKTATGNRAIHSFGSPRDLRHLYELRATADAVMCGARTVETANTVLGTGGEAFQELRRKNGLAEHALRIIVSGSGSVDPAAKVFRERFSPVIVLTTKRIPRQQLARLRAAADEVILCGDTEIEFARALRRLRATQGVKRLLCEGGGELNDALFRGGWVDEIHLTLCPKLFGGRTAPTLADGAGALNLQDSARFRLAAIRRSGGELFTTFRSIDPHVNHEAY